MHSTLAKPMQDTIDHSAPRRSAVVWTQKSTNTFVDTKIAISRCPLMYFIDDNKLDIRLYTDASDFGIGGVLFQVVGVTRTPSIPGIPCSGTNVRTVRIEDDPIHTICCMIPAVLICKLITLLSFSIAR